MPPEGGTASGPDLVRKATFARPDAAVVAEFLALPDMAGLVARAMDRLGVGGSVPAHVLTPLAPGLRAVGPAVTIRNVPSRHVPLRGWQDDIESRLGERDAYFVAEPGDVVVIDSGGRLDASNLGPNSAALALAKGIVGAVVDGLVTGPAGIRGHAFPVWCRGATTVTGHHRVHTVEINGTVACGSSQVSPGDLVVADDSGVTFVPAEHIAEVLEVARGLGAKGRALAEAVAGGASPTEIRDQYRSLLRG